MRVNKEFSSPRALHFYYCKLEFSLSQVPVDVSLLNMEIEVISSIC